MNILTSFEFAYELHSEYSHINLPTTICRQTENTTEFNLNHTNPLVFAHDNILCFNRFSNRLTSIGLDVLSKCSYQEWEYILYIDIPILNKMAMWLVQQQNESTGAFWETSMLFDHSMRVSLFLCVILAVKYTTGHYYVRVAYSGRSFRTLNRRFMNRPNKQTIYIRYFLLGDTTMF